MSHGRALAAALQRSAAGSHPPFCADRFEFGVSGFQRGNPELLKSLKRHDAQRSSRKAGGTRGERGGHGAAAADSQLVELGAYGGMHSEIEQLKRDRVLLLREVMRLREASARTDDTVRSLSDRLAATESVQGQMLTFLQQHISPGLLQASQHLLPGRKRRHLLLPPSPGREEAMDMEELLGPLPAADQMQMQHQMQMQATSLSLHELPDAEPAVLPPQSTPLGHAPPPPAELLSPSYDPLGPPPALPSVLTLPGGAGADTFQWSDLLDGEFAAMPPSPNDPAPGLGFRMDSQDILAIMRDLQVNPPAVA